MTLFGIFSRQGRAAPRGDSTACVLLVADRPNWAYDSIAKALVKHNDDPELALEVEYVKNGRRRLEDIHRDYDFVFMLGWQLLGRLENGCVEPIHTFLDSARTLTGIHSHHSWDDRRTQPDESVLPPPVLVDFLNDFAGVNAVSRRLYELFMSSGLEQSSCTLNGVDTDLFTAECPIRTEGPLRVGFSGNNKHDWRKGISEFIEPACDMEGVELRLAMPKEGYHVPLDRMPGFYREIDAYVLRASTLA